ncbi:hypothetical protein AOXY_G5724 [Acipenser oxyrinchus oxyrinchus]|uniref:Uncharacterized protein n=1 Tax=Acipenser oxyrinchus oxyrinchus TaxID=40147 RepID=A0AAD8GF45_ACIOX|nr:hypothetical protein AOXY_G5724 [Acipenser oxyrinchus oxyrinchus]
MSTLPSLKMASALGIFLLVILVHTEASSSSGKGGKSFPHDMTLQSDLTKLYNSPVYKVDRMRQPIGGLSFALGILSHSGVRATLANGSQWLIHKGDGFGRSSQTVVVNAKHMSSDWKIIETKDFRGTKTIGDFVKAGGTDYNVIFDNCHFGSRRMMDQKKK